MMEQTVLLKFDTCLPKKSGKLSSFDNTAASDLSGFHPKVIETACGSWEDRARSEYIGVLLLRQLHGILIDLNAPMDIQELVLMIQLQEQQHTRYCIEMAKILGSTGELTCTLDELQFERQQDPVMQIYDIMMGTFFIGEFLALILLRHTLRSLPDSLFKNGLKTIFKDEVFHSKFGALILQFLQSPQNSWLPYPPADWIKSRFQFAIESLESRDVVHAHEAEMFDDAVYAHQLPLLGVPDSRKFKNIYLNALKYDIPEKIEKYLTP